MIEESMAARFDPPAELTSAIIGGRCIAFVGAGFSMCALPGWSELLADLGAELSIPVEVPKSASALQLEAIGQLLCDKAGAAWEPAIQRVLDRAMNESAPKRATLDRRCQLLAEIPFRAILTTNFDPSLKTSYRSLGPEEYARVLRDPVPRWWSAPHASSAQVSSAPVLKLHGDANGSREVLPVVLGRADYRTRVYGDPNYANFLRAAFAQYTVLFLGVSFTDAYLNELRSEVLHLVHGRDRARPWGYAVVNDPGDDYARFLEKHEGIQVMPTARVEELDDWLAAIATRTSIRGRLERIFGGANRGRIVWIDPAHKRNNQEGHSLLGHAASIEELASPDELEDRHRDVDLIITSFGHSSGLAYSLLERVRGWPARPPVIVFAHPDNPHRTSNRRECLRRGAWEYTTQWAELYRAIELALGRVPGDDAAY